MNLNIKATNIELDEKIKDYVDSKILPLDKFFNSESEISVFVEIGRESNKRQNGPDVFMAEIRFVFDGKDFYVKNYAPELFTAIDMTRDEAQRKINDRKEKAQTLFVRGARKIKKRIKGMKPWWPFNGKSE